MRCIDGRCSLVAWLAAFRFNWGGVRYCGLFSVSGPGMRLYPSDSEFNEACDSYRAAHADCACKGECLCHAVGLYGGVPCPFNCTVVKFDGCHRCDPECVKAAAKGGKA